jgi:hypothetical protein
MRVRGQCHHLLRVGESRFAVDAQFELSSGAWLECNCSLFRFGILLYSPARGILLPGNARTIFDGERQAG